MAYGAIIFSAKDPGRKEEGVYNRWAGDTMVVAVLPGLKMILPSEHWFRRFI